MLFFNIIYFVFLLRIYLYYFGFSLLWWWFSYYFFCIFGGGFQKYFKFEKMKFILVFLQGLLRQQRLQRNSRVLSQHLMKVFWPLVSFYIIRWRDSLYINTHFYYYNVFFLIYLNVECHNIFIQHW